MRPHSEIGQQAGGFGNIGGMTVVSLAVVAVAAGAVLVGVLISPGPELFATWLVLDLLVVTLACCRVRWALVGSQVVVRQLMFRRAVELHDVVDAQGLRDMRWRQGVGYRWAPGERAMVCGSRDVIGLDLSDGTRFSFSVDDASAFLAAYTAATR